MITSLTHVSKKFEEGSLKQPLTALSSVREVKNRSNNFQRNSKTTCNIEGLTNMNGERDVSTETGNKHNNKSENEEKPIRYYEKYKVWLWEFETPIIWYSVFFIVLWHILAVYVVLTYPLTEKISLALYATWIGGMSGFGVTAGAHRYFTHRSFKAKLPLKLILLMCYSIAGQNSLYDWVRDHRVHHKFTETNADPHNANRGFFFSHVGWLMMRKHPDVIKKGRTLDLSDLTEDPLVVFHVKYWIIFKLFFCFLLPSSIPPLLWGESWYLSFATICIVRYIISLNATWAVNSFAHFYGNRPYDKRIYSVENSVVSFFAMGEGYHNYHHTFPWDYRAAELGQMLNVTTLWLNFFQKIGWAYDLKAPPNELIKKVAINHGDGTHYKWGHEVPETADLIVEEFQKKQ
ncbi:acyl-CoA Delta-9 desaturase-like [Diorhabda carinulata]|uniref:acyl-CoA Delta-9 desaturase-like n=1 Tax=Diorhabda carinulata TaxID=1163345 RepID=UPI0025A1CBF4|nr:acyl-CoA Delta-9 desaturase-like [Diorhabda carinulata]